MTTIRAKLILLPLLGVTLLAALYLYTGAEQSRLSRVRDVAYSLERQSTFLEMLTRGVDESLLTHGTLEPITIAERGIQGFDRLLRQTLGETNHSGLIELRADIARRINPTWLKLRADITPFLRLNEVDPEDPRTLVRYGRLLRDAQGLREELHRLADHARALADTTALETRRNVLIASLLMLALMIALFRHLYTGIALPLGRLRGAIQRIRSAEGNLEQHHRDEAERLLEDLAARGGDPAEQHEVTVLAREFSAMLASVAEQMAERRKAAHSLAEMNRFLEKRVEERTAELAARNEALAHEISERVKVEEQLLEARDRAVAADRMKAQFINNINHELRTPMNGVLGFMELLEDSDLDEEQNEFLRGAQRSGHRLMVLIENLFRLTHLREEFLTHEVLAFPLRPTVETLAAEYRVIAERRGLTLSVEVEEPLPERVIATPQALEQTLIPLLDNAVRFTEQGSIQLNMEYLEGDDAQLRVTLRDSGIGMSPEVRERAFEAFYQGDASTTRLHEGAGVGLTVAQQLVEAMGGTIGLDSAPGEGTTVWFTLPLVLAEDESHASSAA